VVNTLLHYYSGATRGISP